MKEKIDWKEKLGAIDKKIKENMSEEEKEKLQKEEENFKILETILRYYYKHLIKIKHKNLNIVDVAEYFNIPIDIKRLYDYEIHFLRNDIFPVIEIIDTKENIQYISNFYVKGELLDVTDNPIFNNLDITNFNTNIQTKYLYYIGQNSPIKSQLIIPNDKYELVFEKEQPNDLGFGNSSNIFVVRFYEKYEKEGMTKKEQLFANHFHTFENDIENTMKQFITYDFTSSDLPREDRQDIYAYTINSNIIHGINELETINEHITFNAFASMENTKITNIERYLPINYISYEKEELKSDNINAAIWFSGYNTDNTYYAIKIFKKFDKINLNLHCRYIDEQHHTIEKTEIRELPILVSGKLTIEEIDSIIDLLNHIYPDNLFMSYAIDQIRKFQTEIKIKEKIINKEENLLDPEMLSSKEYDEITNMVLENKSAYFDLALEQFYNATHMGEAREKKQNQYQKLLNKK